MSMHVDRTSHICVGVHVYPRMWAMCAPRILCRPMHLGQIEAYPTLKKDRRGGVALKHMVYPRNSKLDAKDAFYFGVPKNFWELNDSLLILM